MKRAILAVSVVLACAGVASAALPFFDDFEAGVNGTNTWYNWRSSPDTWPPPNPSGINNLLQTSSDHNITVGGSKSAKAVASDPAAWNAYSDFGAQSGNLRADVWVFEDNSYVGTQPVTNMLALIGDGANPGAFSDYIQIGVVPFWTTGSSAYGFRTRYNDANGLGYGVAGVARKSGWTKLSVEVDSLASGGQIRFFIDNNPVGTSYRAGANGGAGGLAPVDLRWVRLGNNSKTYENFWYDNVRVIPEPASLMLLALGGLLTLRRR